MKKYKKTGYIKIILVVFVMFNINIYSATAKTVTEDCQYDIAKLDIEVNVTENNTYYITEKYDLSYYSNEELCKKIPLFFDGIDRHISNIEVKSNTGKEVISNIQKDSDNILVYFKNKQSDANESFTVSYTYIMGNDMDDTKDFFYYDLIGNEWATTIDGININVFMPTDFSGEDINLYSTNNKINDKFKYQLDGKVLNIKSSEYLKKNNTLSLAINLPEGYFKVKKDIFCKFPNLIDITVLCFIVIILILTLKNKFCYKILVNSSYEDEENDNNISLLSPIEISYIYNQGASIRDVMFYLYYWDDKGYITLIKEKYDYKIVFKEIFINAPYYEENLYNYLLDMSKDKVLYVSQIKPDFERKAKETITEMKNDLTKKRNIFDTSFNIKGRIYRDISLFLLSLILGILIYDILGKKIYIFETIAFVTIGIHGFISMIQSLFNKNIKYTTARKILLLFELIAPYGILFYAVSTLRIPNLYTVDRFYKGIVISLIALVLFIITLCISYLDIPLSNFGGKIRQELDEERELLMKMQREYIGIEIAYANALDADSTSTLNRDILRNEFREYSDQKI